MPVQTVTRVTAAFADQRHARRALGMLAMARGLSVDVAMQEGEPGRCTLVDFDVEPSLVERLLQLLRMTGGVPVPASR